MSASILRYHIALDIFEYAANAGIAHVSKLISENLEKLEEIKVRQNPLYDIFKLELTFLFIAIPA